jgi:uncharacterized protein (DUF1778 family)
MPETKKRRKPKAQRKEDSIRLRCTAQQKAILTEAAARDGQGVSAWLLGLGLRDARRAAGAVAE